MLTSVLSEYWCIEAIKSLALLFSMSLQLLLRSVICLSSVLMQSCLDPTKDACLSEQLYLEAFHDCSSQKDRPIEQDFKTCIVEFCSERIQDDEVLGFPGLLGGLTSSERNVTEMVRCIVDCRERFEADEEKLRCEQKCSGVANSQPKLRKFLAYQLPMACVLIR